MDAISMYCHCYACQAERCLFFTFSRSESLKYTQRAKRKAWILNGMTKLHCMIMGTQQYCQDHVSSFVSQNEIRGLTLSLLQVDLRLAQTRGKQIPSAHTPELQWRHVCTCSYKCNSLHRGWGKGCGTGSESKGFVDNTMPCVFIKCEC